MVLRNFVFKLALNLNYTKGTTFISWLRSSKANIA
jgi:hypothetical protein